MKVQELRDLTRQELLGRVTDLHDENFNLRMRRSLKSLDNPLRFREIRRELARINTILKEDAQGKRKLAKSKGTVLSAGETKADKKQ